MFPFPSKGEDLMMKNKTKMEKNNPSTTTQKKI